MTKNRRNWKNILDTIKNTKDSNLEKVLIGKYLVTGKLVEKKGYQVKPSSYWSHKILKI